MYSSGVGVTSQEHIVLCEAQRAETGVFAAPSQLGLDFLFLGVENADQSAFDARGGQQTAVLRKFHRLYVVVVQFLVEPESDLRFADRRGI